jgi:hypothetical protein
MHSEIIAVSRDITSKKTEEQQLKFESVITNTHESATITEAEYDKK